jgi:flagellar basal body-associated protein FliL
MKNEGVPRTGMMLYRILQGIAAVLVLVLFAGTLYAFILPPDRPAQAPKNGLPQSSVSGFQSQDGVFTGIGRIRSSTAGPEPSTVIFSVTFPYPENDKPFAEELNSQIVNFRNTAYEYFASLSTEELRQKDEPAIKTEILRRYNLLLRLGRIETLYFNEFLIIE